MSVEGYKIVSVESYFHSLDELKKLHSNFRNIQKLEMDDIIEDMYVEADYYEYLINFYKIEKFFDKNIENQFYYQIIQVILDYHRIEGYKIDLKHYQDLRKKKE